LDDRATELTQRLIGKMYAKSAADQKEIEAVFTDAHLPAARREQLTGQQSR
jgi:hypothetical protein